MVNVTDTARCEEAGRHVISTRHMGAECPFAPTQEERETAHYERAIRLINLSVSELNGLLGYSEEFDADARREGISFGYIGNIPTGAAQGSKHDDRSFSVFLPHPGRAGTVDDRIGGFAYGDWKGAGTVAAQLRAMILLTRNQANRSH